MDTISFRQASLPDADAILALMREYYAFDHLVFDDIRARSALEDLIQHWSFGAVWLILSEDTPAGYIVLTFGYSLEFYGRFGLIDELYLQPAYRNRGIGKQAMGFVQEICHSAGIRVLRLEVERENLHAQEVYHHEGFVAHDRNIMTKRSTR